MRAFAHGLLDVCELTVGGPWHASFATRPVTEQRTTLTPAAVTRGVASLVIAVCGQLQHLTLRPWYLLAWQAFEG